MAIAEQLSFTLVRFEWTPPDRLDVAGAWSGIERGDLSDVTIVLHCRGSMHRLEAVRGVFNNPRNWSVGFAWRGDPASVERAELVLGGSLVVELPSGSKQVRRRFGRTALAVRALEQQSVPAAGSAADVDALALHAALVAAQNEVAEGRDKLAGLQAEIERAREQAKRERARRESDVARLQDSMNTLRRLAENSLEQERQATRGVCAQLDELETSVSSFRTEATQLREQAQAAVAGRAEATEEVRLQQTEIEGLRSKLDQLAHDSRERSERAQVEVDEARARIASAEAEVVAARAAGGEAEGLRKELAGAQRESERALAEVERLRSKLVALREVVEQQI